jgi:MFS family permease
MVGLAFAIYTVSYGMSNVFGVFLKPLISEFGWNRGLISSAYSINQIAFGIFALVSGAFSDRYGVRKVLIINGAIYGVGLMLMSRTTSIWHVYLFYGVIAGAGYGSLVVPTVTAVTKWFDKRRGLAVGITQSGMGAGMFIFSPLAAHLNLSYGWRSAYLLYGLIVLAVVIPAALFIKDEPSLMGLRTYGADGDGESVDINSPDASVSGITGRKAVRTRPFWFLNCIHFSDCICHSIILVHLVAYLIDIGFTSSTAASVLGVVGASAAAGTIVSGILTDRIGGCNALRSALVCQLIMVVLLFIVRDLWMIYIIAVFFGLGLGGLITPYPVLTRQYFSETAAGTIYGSQLVCATTGMALGGFLGGFLYDVTGNYITSFTVSLCAGTVALIVGLSLRKSEAVPAPALQL